MTHSEPSRLDRVEALLEAIATDLAAVKDLAISNARAIAASQSELESVKDLAMSNARAIEARGSELSELRQQWQRDRDRLYQTMADLANAQASFYHAQASFYNNLAQVDARQDRLDRRQGEIVEILKLLTKQE